jgi:hypothetical protein
MKHRSTINGSATDDSARTAQTGRIRYEQRDEAADAAHARRQKERQIAIDRLQAEMRGWSLRDLFNAQIKAS